LGTKIIVKVIKRFKDKYTKEIKEVGQVMKITKERYEQLATSPSGVFVEKLEIVEDEVVYLDDMTKKEIIEYAESKGIELNPRMTKAEMIKELM
jgi:hypothetical protein